MIFPEMVRIRPIEPPHGADSRVAAALFGNTQRAVLSLLFCHSDHAYYLSEIIRAAGTGAGAVQRELDRLRDAGLVTRSKRGNLVFYRANRDAPVFPALQELMIRTAGVADVLRAALAPLSESIRAAFIYGSIARGEERAGSDVDLMVIGDVSFTELVDALHPTQEILGREVNPNVYTPDEWSEKAAGGHSFITEVLGEPKISLIGDADEPGRLAAKRVASAA
jgi:predicted nucleotidyltransferase